MRAVDMDGPLVLKTTLLKSGADLEAFVKDGQATFQTVAIGNATTIALSGAAHSVRHYLNPPNASDETELELDIPQCMVMSDTGNVVTLDPNMRMLFTDTRTVVAINGTLAQAVSGQGSARVQQLLCSSEGSETPVMCGEHMTTINLTYGDWKSPSATVTARNANVIRKETGQVVGVLFDEAAVEVQAKLEKRHYDALVKYSEACWAERTKHTIYKPLPTLTKTSALGAHGAEFVAEAIHRPSPYSDETLSKMLEIEVEACSKDYKKFWDDTKTPGLAASAHTHTVADALSTCVIKLVSYHADGSVIVGTEGLECKSKEFWNQNGTSDPTGLGVFADDCDASATYTLTVLTYLKEMANETCDKYPIFAHVRNAIALHTPCLSVLSALGPEASKGHHKEPSFAGHAATLLLPTHLVHLGLYKASKDDDLAELRHTADFEPFLATLPEKDRSMCASFDAIKRNAQELSESIVAAVVEGTTPAESILYDAKRFAEIYQGGRDDRCAMEKVPANIGRCTTRLTFGRSEDESLHQFYREFVEITFNPKSKHWTNKALRERDLASTQYVLIGSNGEVGASPKDLVEGTFSLQPIAPINNSDADTIDAAAAAKRLYYESPRAETAPTLLPFEAENVRASLRELESLQKEGEARGESEGGHALEYHVGVNALVNNPRAVAHFCATMRNIGKAIDVTIDKIPSLATFPDARSGDALAFVRVTVET